MSLKARLKMRYKKKKPWKNSDHSHDFEIRALCFMAVWNRSTWKRPLPKHTNAMLDAVCSSVLDAGY